MCQTHLQSTASYPWQFLPTIAYKAPAPSLDFPREIVVKEEHARNTRINRFANTPEEHI